MELNISSLYQEIPKVYKNSNTKPVFLRATKPLSVSSKLPNVSDLTVQTILSGVIDLFLSICCTLAFGKQQKQINNSAEEEAEAYGSFKATDHGFVVRKYSFSNDERCEYLNRLIRNLFRCLAKSWLFSSWQSSRTHCTKYDCRMNYTRTPTFIVWTVQIQKEIVTVVTFILRPPFCKIVYICRSGLR